MHVLRIEGSAPTRVRRKECAAFGTTCNHCNRDHHFGKMCRSRNTPRQTTNDEGERESAVFDTLCEITSQGGRDCVTLDHHIFNQSTSEWHKRQSKPQPFIRLSMNIQGEDYEHFGLLLPPRHLLAPGCQSCLAGFKVVKKLGLSTKDLIPVNQRMHAADIQILGATILRLSGKDAAGKERSTRQVVYVTNHTDKLFLSREACTDLGIISRQFPLLGEAKGSQPNQPQSVHATTEVNPTQECNCPKRTTEKSWSRFTGPLQLQHLQHLRTPTTTNEPMRLMIDPNATPTAYHSPIPVPLHWQDDVKAGLDRDVRLGVIEPVPIAEPVTWCHRMVICAKKNGRTICTCPRGL